ncbi:MAG: Rne/Rng family ribonuclease [bacterium]
MQKLIVINSSASSTRVAITEDGNLVDFFVDNVEQERMVGDIYLGKIARVLPGIKAAFIDIGLKHDAFLHFSDIGERLESLQGMLEDDDDEEDIGDEEQKLLEKAKKTESNVEKKKIYSKLHKGEEILVQIIKEPVKDKGVRVTSAISVPGRFCVLLPFDNKIGISKKISDFKERRRLKKLARSILPANCGLIIRTAALEQSEEILASDLKYLVETWHDIQESAKQDTPPSVVYKDLSTTSSVIRDLFTPDISKVLIDSKKSFREIKNYLKLVQPELIDKIEYYKSDEPIFEAFKVEEQIKTLMGRKVALPAGGHIVIDHTEAMFVIDVNSGRYAAKKEQELNSLKTDLEASREIVRQLRLRDIGGLIVIDFIDLEDDKNRKKIYDELKKEFKKDRAKVALLPMTDFGLMQITRQRIRENILQSINEECPYCYGTGLLTRRSHLIHEIEDWIKKYKNKGIGRVLYLKVNPSLALKLQEGFLSPLRKLEFKYFVRVKLIVDIKVSVQKFHFLDKLDGKDITDEIE